jgi:hypothetical protein
MHDDFKGFESFKQAKQEFICLQLAAEYGDPPPTPS